MRVLVFGATGMLGKALMRQWTRDELTGLGSADANLRNPDQVEAVVTASRPDWIVLSAAYTDVDGCEINPTLASTVNTYGALNVAKSAHRANARLLFLSTDYVFDGTGTTPYETSHPRHPINEYGKTKAEAEVKILELLPDACIVRTSWLFGPWGKCFPDTIINIASKRQELEVVNDQRGSPTYTFDLAAAIAQLCRAGAKGIVHCTNRGDCTWYDFAGEIVRQSGLHAKVKPTTSERFVRPAQRPAYSVLSSQSLSSYGISMRPWQDTLAEYLSLRTTAPL
jgi:dTDP-4-dehydrorhamnose reductase